MRRALVVLLMVAVPAGAAVLPAGTAGAAPAHAGYSGPCHAAVDKYFQRDRQWAHMVTQRESLGRPGSRNKSSGAAGCFQLMPQYYRRWMRSAGCSNVWDADCNVRTAWWLYNSAKQGRRPWRVR